MRWWHSGKDLIEGSVAVSQDSLHVIFGIIVWLVLVLGIRRPISSWLPWLGVLAVILWNETVDLRMERWPDRSVQYWQAIKDIGLTMFVPSVLMMAARFTPGLFGSWRRRT